MGLGILLLPDTGLEEDESDGGSSFGYSAAARKHRSGNVKRSRSSAEGKCSQDRESDGDRGAGKHLRVGESGSRTGMRLARGDSSRGDDGTGEHGTPSSPGVSAWFGVTEGPPSGHPESLSMSFSVTLMEVSGSTAGSGGWLQVLGGELVGGWVCSSSAWNAGRS